MENTSEIKSEKKNFCFRAKSILLTYSRCSLTKQQLGQYLVDNFKPKRLICSMEFHKDKDFEREGEPISDHHFHVLMQWQQAYYTKNERKFDVYDFHPNIRFIGDIGGIKKATKYVTKEDKDPFLFGLTLQDLKQEIEARDSHRKIICMELMSGKPLVQVVEEHPIALFDYKKYKEALILYKADLLFKSYDYSGVVLSKEKRRHYWIYGQSNTGKTTFLKNLIKALPPNSTYQIPTNNDWGVPPYTQQPILYLDEFSGSQLTLQQLNSICDGGIRVNTKGGSNILHPWPIVILCTNHTVEEAYSTVFKNKPALLATLVNRFNFVPALPNIEWGVFVLAFFDSVKKNWPENNGQIEIKK